MRLGDGGSLGEEAAIPSSIERRVDGHRGFHSGQRPPDLELAGFSSYGVCKCIQVQGEGCRVKVEGFRGFKVEVGVCTCIKG